MNTDAMIEVREAIRMNPKLHRQALWVTSRSCGTSYCIAGWRMHLDGLTLENLADRETSPAEYARARFGLTGEEAEVLFYEMDSQVALERLDEYIERSKNA